MSHNLEQWFDDSNQELSCMVTDLTNDNMSLSDTESNASWHSCLSKPIRPPPPINSVVVNEASTSTGLIHLGDEKPPVCIVRPSVLDEAPVFRLTIDEVDQMFQPTWLTRLHSAYSQSWGRLTWVERLQLLLVFVGVTYITHKVM